MISEISTCTVKYVHKWEIFTYNVTHEHENVKYVHTKCEKSTQDVKYLHKM